MRAGNEPGARRRHVDRPREPGLLPSSASAAAPCRTARPSSPRDAPREETRRSPRCGANSCAGARDHRLEQHDAGRKIRRGDDAACRRRRPPCAAPASCCRQPVVPMTRLMPRAGERRHVRRRPTSGVEKSIATSTPAQRSRVRAAAVHGETRIDHARDLAAVFAARALSTSWPILPWPTSSSSHACLMRRQAFGPLEERLVQPHHRMRHVGVAQDERDVAPRRRPATRAAAECRSSAVTARPNSVGSVAQILADRADDRHLRLAARPRRNSRRLSRIASSRRVSSTVTDTLTSDVVTTSTAVLNRSNTSNSRRRKPCAISIRVEVMSMTVTSRLQASAVSCAVRRRRRR